VIVDVQRAGPATGGATTVGQGTCSSPVAHIGRYPIIALLPLVCARVLYTHDEAFDWPSAFAAPCCHDGQELI